MVSTRTRGNEILTDPFHLTQADGNITEADGTANSFSDIWKYQVPIGVSHVIRTGDTFSAYLEDSSPAQVGNATCRVQIEVRDPAEQDKMVVLGPMLYLKVKEFQDMQLVAKIRIPTDVIVGERYWIVVMVRDDGTIDASDSYFDLNISRARARVI